MFDLPGYIADLHQFNPASNTWTDLSEGALRKPPVIRVYPVVAALNNTIYIFGGFNPFTCECSDFLMAGANELVPA